MSYIIKSEQDIVELSYLLEKLRNKGYNNDLLEEIFNTIVPKNSHFPISVLFGKSKTPVFFSVKDQKIWVSPERLKHFINITINILVKNYPNLEKEIFYNFVLLVVLHEVEHYYQYLICFLWGLV